MLSHCRGIIQNISREIEDCTIGGMLQNISHNIPNQAYGWNWESIDGHRCVCDGRDPREKCPSH